MINIIGAIIIFFIAITTHELTHYITAKHFKLKPRFTWVSTKDKKCIRITKFLPGVKYNACNYRQYKWIALSPFPICIIPFSLVFIILFYPSYNPNVHWWFLPISFFFGALTSYGASIADINDVKKFKSRIFKKVYGHGFPSKQ